MKDRARNTAADRGEHSEQTHQCHAPLLHVTPAKGWQHTRSACNPAMNPAQMQQGGSDLNGRMDSQTKAGLRRLNRSLKRV